MKLGRRVSRIPWLILVLFLVSLVGNGLFLVDRWQGSIVVSVPDGDSLQLADGRRIRLLGIDAPEKGRCMADAARQTLVSLALGKHVRLKHLVTDDYGRQLGIAIVEDWQTWFGYLRWRFLGESLTRDPLLQRGLLGVGLARYSLSTSNPYYRVLKDVVEVAKSGKLGIWSDVCRGQTSGNEDCAIKGNTRAGKKTYFLPDCPNYPEVIVDRAFGDAWFCKEDQATKAGFTLATSCK